MAGRQGTRGGVSGDTGEVRLDLVASEEHGEGGDVWRARWNNHRLTFIVLESQCYRRRISIRNRNAFTARRDGRRLGREALEVYVGTRPL